MASAAKVVFVALAAALLTYIGLCLGLYAYGLRQWPPHMLDPPAALAPALQQQLERVEGVQGRPVPRLHVLTLPLELPFSHEHPFWWGILSNSTPRYRLPALQRRRAHLIGTPAAIYISRHWSREQILGGYARYANFGRQARGVEAAAQAWYGLPLAQLQPQETLALWVLMASPSYYDPICRADNFDQRFRRYAQRLPELADASPDAARRRMRPMACAAAP